MARGKIFALSAKGYDEGRSRRSWQGGNSMVSWAAIGRALVRCGKAFFLFVFASVVGANLGLLFGFVPAVLTGEWAWSSHLRCTGWTLFAIGAVVGSFTGHARFGAGARPGARRQPPEVEETPESGPVGKAVKTEGRLKSLLVSPLVGAFAGLILGGMAGGFLVAVYFCLALSPFGPGGWWPVLPLSYRTTGEGFSTDDPWLIWPWAIVVGAFVLAGALLATFTTVTVGKKRYEVFPSRRAGETP
jgi:hypothetical protein